MPVWEVGETETDDDSGDFDLIDKLEEVFQDPEMQRIAIQRAQENNIPPEILAGFLPGNEVSPGDVVKAIQAQQTDNTPPESAAQPDKERKPGIPDEDRGMEPDEGPDEPTTMPTQTDEFDADKLLDVIDQLIEIHGGDTTLAEFRDWAEQNTDLIENFADELT